MSRFVCVALVATVALLCAACEPSNSNNTGNANNAPPPVYSAHRETLTSAPASLYVPAGYAPTGNAIDIVVHFHGAPSFVEAQYDVAAKRAALVTVNYSGLSSAYSNPFSNQALLGQILDEAIAAVGAVRNVPAPLRGRVVLSSFSAGYGATRQILLGGQYDAWIGDVVLADSLHAGYAAGGGPNPTQMAPFAAFAARAAAGEVTMTLSHSSIVPGTYASTTETADYLIAWISATRTPMSFTNPHGMLQTSEVSVAGFLVKGYAGNTAADHSDHLQNIGEYLTAINLPTLP